MMRNIRINLSKFDREDLDKIAEGLRIKIVDTANFGLNPTDEGLKRIIEDELEVNVMNLLNNFLSK